MKLRHQKRRRLKLRKRPLPRRIRITLRRSMRSPVMFDAGTVTFSYE
jgi:hypothetical protein